MITRWSHRKWQLSIHTKYKSIKFDSVPLSIEQLNTMFNIWLNHYFFSNRWYLHISGKIQTTRSNCRTIKAFDKHTFSLQFIVPHIQHLLQRFRWMIVDFTQPNWIIVALANWKYKKNHYQSIIKKLIWRCFALNYN